jgi:hypothetical protein
MSPTSSRLIESDRFALQRVAFFGRTLAEYLAMFAIDPDELSGLSILDVASGPSSFGTEARARGLDVTGCDPMYGMTADAIAELGKADIDACVEQIRTLPGLLVFQDREAFCAAKYDALTAFVADFRLRSGDGRYVAGALPNLPFDDDSFDLVLSANFLMVYAPLADGGMHDGQAFGLEFHRQAFRELARVTRGELRVPGIHTWTQPPGPHPYGEPMKDLLESLGFTVEFVSSDYDDGSGATEAMVNRVLVARRSSDATV